MIASDGSAFANSTSAARCSSVIFPPFLQTETEFRATFIFSASAMSDSRSHALRAASMSRLIVCMSYTV
ncbi:hypothetical protein B1L07_08135 [Stenotrophomonas acidaminiphila]|nr:hypothetical protein B1L07_08135 [Stenotrophomonas acidaminiphila]